MSDGGQDVAVADARIRPVFDPTGPRFLWMALRLSLWTILTLGLYRFWMAARLRRYYWNAVRVLGDPFEYTGRAIEKFLGFLVALVLLSVYLAVVNLGLAFLGLISFDNPTGIEFQIILNLSVLASLPLVFFAIYRARRYLAARTRWRGIRFGMERAGWHYAGLAVLLSVVSVISLGLLYPMQHFFLTRFSVNRTWFGDRPFRQEGRWTALFGAWVLVYLGLVPVIAGLIVLGDAKDDVASAIGYVLIALGYPLIFLLWTRYNVVAFRYFWANRNLGETSFANDVSALSVTGVYVGGVLAISIAAILTSLLLVGVVFAFWTAAVGPEVLQTLSAALDDTGGTLAAWPVFAAGALTYLTVVIVVMALGQVLLARPILRRQVEGMTVVGATALSTVQQRPHDDAAEAGGFADALGVDAGTGF